MTQLSASKSALVLTYAACCSAACSPQSSAPKYETLPSLIAALELGGLSVTEYESRFGKSLSSKTYAGIDGGTLVTTHLYRREGTNDPGRLLVMEFRAGLLSGWLYHSQDDDTSPATSFSVASVQPYLTSKSAVQTLLGRPSGKARCPSWIDTYIDRCKSAELWHWLYSPRYSQSTGAPRELYIGFNDAGSVHFVDVANPLAESEALHQRLVAITRQHLASQGFVQGDTLSNVTDGWSTTFVRAPYSVRVALDYRNSLITLEALEQGQPTSSVVTLHRATVRQAHLRSAYDQHLRAAFESKLSQYVSQLRSAKTEK